MDLQSVKQLSAYTFISHEPLPDIHAEGVILRHKKSGARIALIPSEDDNKVFNIAFRTPPADSTGVAHIIEHTVLCGSENYPLKDPFVELAKGSLNTFLNAITYPDKTMYPVASTNDTDFRNLMHVYLDAVFFPKIYSNKNIFRQEGWHYELRDREEELKINGVVYNEMKGVFSSADSVLEREMMNSLFPDTSYGVESGGDPEMIPSLTYEAYLDFHRRYYHPSNAYIFLYGDVDMEDTLKFLDREYLSRFDAIDPDSALAVQKSFESGRRIEKDYPASEGENPKEDGFLMWSAVAGDPFNMEEMIAFDVLDYALFSAPGAPVKQALIDAGIGQDVYGEYNDGILQPYFSVVAKQADVADADRFVSVIREVLTGQAEHGISKKSLNAGINNLEFQFREADFSTIPKGLMYTIDMLDTWLYDDEKPFPALHRLDAFSSLRAKAEEGYFETLIREKLLRNPHSALLILKPREGMAEEREKQWKEKLAAYKNSLSEEELGQVIKETEDLLLWQDEEDSEEAILTVPLLQRSDIGKQARKLSNIPSEETVRAADGREVTVPFILHEADSNGIFYAELLWNTQYVSEEMVPYLGLLKAVLFSVNTERFSYMDLSNEINEKTGGISAGLNVIDDAADPDRYTGYFGILAKALYKNLPDAADLIGEAIFRSKLTDRKRIREILQQQLAQLKMTLQQAGHLSAALRASAYRSPSGAYQDRTSGIGYYRFLQGLAESYDEMCDTICMNLIRLSEELFTAGNLLISITAEKDALDALKAGFGKCIAAECKNEDAAAVSVAPYGRLNEAFVTPGQVQFVAATGNFRKKEFAYSGAMAVFRQIMAFEYLWQNIRVRGGAYGCSASLKRNGDGMFTSYRDPHLKRTKDIFLNVPEYLAAFDANEREMTKYIIGTINGMDIPLTPALLGSISLRSYLSGVTQEMMQRTRDEILSVTPKDIRALAEPVRALLADGCFCVVGGETEIKKHSGEFLSVEALL